MAENSEVTSHEKIAAGAQWLCPKCQSARVYRSHRRTVKERLRSFSGYYPYRCHACDHRFVLRASHLGDEPGVKDPRKDISKRRRRRMIRNLVICVICVVVFLVFLHYLIQPSQIPSDS